MWNMFGDQKYPKILRETHKLQNITCFSFIWYIYIILLCSMRNNSTGRMVGKIKIKLYLFFHLSLSSKICNITEMAMNAAGWSPKFPSLPPVTANSRRVTMFFSFSNPHSAGPSITSILGRHWNSRLLRGEVRKWVSEFAHPTVMVLK